MLTIATQSDLESPSVGARTEKDLLRFITCGSVDDGKSTLIGRLMLDAGAIYQDQILSLQNDSARLGTNGDEIDTALLLDGLEDERQQGITIDVAYRYFATEKRKFIVADTPGHEQFTRNMATGASTADLAIILVDATKGILTQTKRHAFIVSLLGIKHVILAVNKMDLLDFDQAQFESICDDFRQFAARLDIPDVRFVPLSARNGDNVATPSSKTLWYVDGSLLHLLETIYVGSDQNRKDFRFPVQWVNRPDSTFRGYSGTIASGVVRCGDEVVVLPSRARSRVRSIVTMDKELQEAIAPQSVTLTLEDEIDVTRGDMICRVGNLPHIGRRAEVMLVWMSERPLSVAQPYWFKNAAGHTLAEVESLRYEIDVNSLHRRQATTLTLNEIGRCSMSLHAPIAYDSYARNRRTGSFILVDRISHETLAAGMFLDHEPSSDGAIETIEFLLPRPVASHVSVQSRIEQYGHQPFTILLTGPASSGKTTLALALEENLFKSGAIGLLLDGEQMRIGMSRDLGYSQSERSENLRRGAEVCKLINASGQFCIAAFSAPEESMRQRFQEIVGMDRVIHIHLSVPIETCREWDKTGRYAAADRGDIEYFPGVTAEYETPINPDLLLSTSAPLEIADCVDQIVALLRSRRLLN